MRLKDDNFNYVYRNGRVASVEKNGRSILQVKSDDKTGDVSGISLPASRDEIVLDISGERPIIESVAGRNVVSRIEKTLAEVTNSAGHKEAFRQLVNDEMLPTIKTEDTMIAWSAESRKIISDTTWSYDVKAGFGPFDNAAIGRRNAKQQTEFWHNDSTKGTEVISTADGRTVVTKRFTSGIIAEKVRTVFEIRNGVQSVLFKARYGEDGSLLETDSLGRNTKYFYSNNLLSSFSVNDGSKIRIADGGIFISVKLLKLCRAG